MICINLIRRYIVLGKRWVDKYLHHVSANAEILTHHGIKGQKWGERNDPPYPLKKKVLPHEYEIEDKKTGEKFHLVEGSRIFDKKTFAGKGTKKPLLDDVKNGLVE